MSASTYYFSKSHEWVTEAGGIATVGITDYAQRELGDIVFVGVKAIGTTIKSGGNFGSEARASLGAIRRATSSAAAAPMTLHAHAQRVRIRT